MANGTGKGVSKKAKKTTEKKDAQNGTIRMSIREELAAYSLGETFVEQYGEEASYWLSNFDKEWERYVLALTLPEGQKFSARGADLRTKEQVEFQEAQAKKLRKAEKTAAKSERNQKPVRKRPSPSTDARTQKPKVVEATPSAS